MKNFVDIFVERGYFYQCTALEDLKNLCSSKKICAYIGFDATAKSLHVGNLMQIMILRLLQQLGHKPIVVIGGATSMIGDPTGKDQLRKALTESDIRENINGIKKSLSKFIEFGEGDSDAMLLNNTDWLHSVGYLEFLGDYGRFISINRMLSMDSVKSRLDREQQLTFLEFNYMLLQGYDFTHLNNKYDCVLQIGGSDQWGNILNGVDIIHKKYQKQAFGLTTNLITNANGSKMGKSVDGAVWINEDMLSPYDYYQFWRNIDDKDVVKFAKLYSEYSENEIIKLEELSKKDINSAKKQVAHRLTSMCHGAENADNARDTSIKLFELGQIDENITTEFIDLEKLKNGVSVSDIFVIANLCKSKSEAKNLIRGGGAKINDRKIVDENEIISVSELISDSIKLTSGKKKFVLLKTK